MISNQKGQGIVEASLTMPLVFSLFLGLSFLSYRGFIYYYADFQLYEALICTQHSRVSECDRKLRQNLQRVLLWGKLDQLALNTSFSESRGQMRISWGSELGPAKAFNISLQKKIPTLLKVQK